MLGASVTYETGLLLFFSELKMIVAFAGEPFRKHWLAGRNLAGKPTVKFYVYGTHETR